MRLDVKAENDGAHDYADSADLLKLSDFHLTIGFPFKSLQCLLPNED